MKYDCVIFDLDGTLIDNSAGICSSIANFLPKFGISGVSEKEIRPMFKDCTRSILKNHFNPLTIGQITYVALVAIVIAVIHYVTRRKRLV